MSARSERIHTAIAVRRMMTNKTQTHSVKMATLDKTAVTLKPVPVSSARQNTSDSVSTLPLRDYLYHWLRTYKRGTVKPTTYDTLERVIHSYIQDSCIGSVPLNQLTAEAIQELITEMKEEEGYSYSTCKKVYDCLNASLRYATQRKFLKENPVDFVTMPGKALFHANEITFFSAQECSLILEECAKEYSTGRPIYHYGPCIALILYTGIRLGEAIGLHRSDYDPERAVLKVQRSVCKVRKRDENGNLLPGRILQETSTKSYSGAREIPLCEQAVAVIEKMLANNLCSEYIVTNSKGQMATPEQVDRSFRFLLRNVSLPPSGVHKLRHTFASLLFANKTDVKTISRLLGHASVNITLSTYIHIADQIPHSAVRPLSSLFGPQSA